MASVTDAGVWGKVKRGVKALCECHCTSHVQGCTQCECRGCERDAASREIRRLRLNFFVLLVLSFLGGIGYSSTKYSLHAFITNPTSYPVNSTEWNPSGLGMSETMYSWSVIVYNIGYVILAAVTGVVLKFVPFLHVLSTSLLINLFGSLLYAISTNGGTVIVSRFLAGAYNGIILTASFSYISSREFDFQDAYFLKVTKEGKASSVRKKLQHHPRVKETTFSLLSFAITTSYLVGPVLNLIISYYHGIEQFHWVGWYNMVLAFLCMLLLFILFHGESVFRLHHRIQVYKTLWRNMQFNTFKIVMFVCFIVASYILDSSYGIIDTLFQPILTSHFGFRVKDMTFFYVAMMIVYILGSFLLFILHLMRVGPRVMAIIGILGSITGLLVMADWQSIGHDPCNQYSPYFHPELENMTTQAKPIVHLIHSVTQQEMMCQELDFHSYVSAGDEVTSLLEGTQVVVCQKGFHLGQLDRTLDLECGIRLSGSCLQIVSNQSSSNCFYFRVTSGSLCFEMPDTVNSSNHSTHRSISCDALEHPFSICASFGIVSKDSGPFSMTMSAFQEFKEVIQVLSVAVASHPQYGDANIQANASNDNNSSQTAATPRENCEASKYSCYWNQASKITHHECAECPEICHSVPKSLNFVQFCVGAFFFVIAIPLTRIALMVLIADNLHREMQAPFTGIAVAAGGIARIVTPLWAGPAFVGINLRTVLAMSIELVTFLPLLLGMAVFYSQLEPPETTNVKEQEEKEKDGEELNDMSNAGSSETEEENTLLAEEEKTM